MVIFRKELCASGEEACSICMVQRNVLEWLCYSICSAMSFFESCYLYVVGVTNMRFPKLHASKSRSGYL